MDQLGYENILWLPEIADHIDAKGPIPREICGNCMKKKQQRKPSYKLMSKPNEYLEYLHWILAALILPLEGVISFILVFEMVQQGNITLNLWKPKVSFLIYFKSLFIKRNANLEISWSIYVPILKKNLPTKLLRNWQAKKVLNGSLVHFILKGKTEKQNALIIPWCFWLDLS